MAGIKIEVKVSKMDDDYDSIVLEPECGGKPISFENPIEPDMLETIDWEKMKKTIVDARCSIAIVKSTPQYLTAAICMKLKDWQSIVAVFDPEMRNAIISTVDPNARFAVISHSTDRDYRKGMLYCIPSSKPTEVIYI